MCMCMAADSAGSEGAMWSIEESANRHASNGLQSNGLPTGAGDANLFTSEADSGSHHSLARGIIDVDRMSDWRGVRSEGLTSALYDSDVTLVVIVAAAFAAGTAKAANSTRSAPTDLDCVRNQKGEARNSTLVSGE